MQVLVSLKFGDGNFTEGFSRIAISANIADSQYSTELEFQLPPAPFVPNLYQNWQNKYINLFDTLGIRILPPRSVVTSFDPGDFPRGFTKKIPTNLSPFEKSKQECDRYASELQTQVNQWLEKLRSQLEAQLCLDASSQVLLTIHTQNITSQQTKDILHRLPWREWDYFQERSGLEVEVVLCLSESESSSPQVKDDGIFRRVKITSIFGDSKNINIESDKELIAKLEKRGAELIYLEQPQRQEFSKLWDEPCDILFYSGHSKTSDDGTVGSLQINSQESLNLQEIKNTLGAAIANGLKLAIFNSCDGLGLANQLADLRLPYIIVWREPVPDRTAIRFIDYFLNSYAEGKSLFTSVQKARFKLLELTPNDGREKQIPGLNWLPIVCKNTSDLPPSWEDLGGLTGKLPDSPYKGLSAFKKEDAAIFFGRDRFITDLVNSVKNKSLVYVVGASGSGKSSVVFAGLVPRLRASDNVHIVSFRPGKNPFDALTVALSSHLQSLENFQEKKEIEENNRRLKELKLEVDLLHKEQALCRLIENIVASGQISPKSSTDAPQLSTYAPKSSRDVPWNVSTNAQTSHQRFVLIVDQFEEIYTLTEEKQRQPFIDTLLYAVRHSPCFSLVLTLRADFIGKALIDYEPMGEALQKYPPLVLTSMDRIELTAAIEQPARKMKVEFEKGLSSKLIDDLGERPGRLPLLEFTLLQLWEKHDKWYLTHCAYEEIGGLEKALAKYADSILNPLSAADKEKTERIFIQLIRPGEGTEDTKRTATRTEVGNENWDWVEFLADKRLLVTGWDQSTQEKTVEIIHEALIREWGMLRGWIQNNRQFRIWQERLRLRMYQWERMPQDEGALLSGAVLALAQEKLKEHRKDLSSEEQDFIEASIAARDRKKKQEQRRRRLTVSGLAGGLVGALGLSAFAWLEWQESELTLLKQTNALAVYSLELSNQGKYLDALVEGLRAAKPLRYKKADVSTQVSALQESVYGVKERNQLESHEGPVFGVAFSPDGKTIASASMDNTVKLWNMQGQLIQTLKNGHDAPVSDVAFSPDGKTIASASWDQTVKLWNMQGQPIRTLKGHDGPLESVTFSPDGKIVASSSHDKTVKLWDMQGQLIQTLKGHDAAVWGVAFSPDGKTIASSSYDKTVKLWNIQGQLIQTFRGNDTLLLEIAFSPDGKTIASGSYDKTVKLWNIQGELIQTLKGHDGPVESVTFSPDSKIVASGSQDRTVKLWNMQGQLIQTLKGHDDMVYDVAFSPDGKTIASASLDNTVKLWNTQGDDIQTFASGRYADKGHDGAVIDLAFSPGGKTIASASMDRTVKLWSIQGQELQTFPSQRYKDKGHDAPVVGVAFSPDGKIIASASMDNTVKLWNTQGQLIQTLPSQRYGDKGHDAGVVGVVFSPDGKTIASASIDKTVKLWSIQGKELQTLPSQRYGDKGHDAAVQGVAFSPDGKTIASASMDKTVKLWNTQGQLIQTIPSQDYADKGHKAGIWSVAFSPDGKTIASASIDKTVKLWNTQGQLIQTLPSQGYGDKGHKAAIQGVAFSPDGKTIASASIDKTVKLWNMQGQLIQTLKADDSTVFDVEFSPDGKIVAFAGGDNKVKLRNIQGQEMKMWDRDLDNLLVQGCDWVRDYLKYNANLSEEDRRLCDGIGSGQ